MSTMKNCAGCGQVVAHDRFGAPFLTHLAGEKHAAGRRRQVQAELDAMVAEARALSATLAHLDEPGAERPAESE